MSPNVVAPLVQRRDADYSGPETEVGPLSVDKASELSPEAQNNIRWNLAQWGDRDRWIHEHEYGLRWGGGLQQSPSEMADIASRFLLPHLADRSLRAVLEIAPGAGRFTTELIRVAEELWLVDLSPACIQLCKERFKYYKSIQYSVNDGVSLEMVPDRAFDLVASFDSLVHVEPEIIRAYLAQFRDKLAPGGIVWLDHSGRGVKEIGNRSSMTYDRMHRFASDLGFEMLAQHWRNTHDCISVLRNP